MKHPSIQFLDSGLRMRAQLGGATDKVLLICSSLEFLAPHIVTTRLSSTNSHAIVVISSALLNEGSEVHSTFFPPGAIIATIQCSSCRNRKLRLY